MSKDKPSPGGCGKEKTEVSLVRSSAAEYLTFVAAGGDSEASVEMRYEDENVWLTQKMMAELQALVWDIGRFHSTGFRAQDQAMRFNSNAPACGSGSMGKSEIQSASVEVQPVRNFSSFDITPGPENADTFRRDLHPGLRADYVIANPSFNDPDRFRKANDLRWQFGFSFGAHFFS